MQRFSGKRVLTVLKNLKVGRRGTGERAGIMPFFFKNRVKCIVGVEKIITFDVFKIVD